MFLPTDSGVLAGLNAVASFDPWLEALAAVSTMVDGWVRKRNELETSWLVDETGRLGPSPKELYTFEDSFSGSTTPKESFSCTLHRRTYDVPRFD